MSQFHRSGHTRTNSNGTTFFVRGHTVNRDEWQQQHFQQQTLVSSQYSEYGITYPNAKCPVCRQPVFFFQAYNGGRVFFDPPLGPPWNKHPCTTKEPERANGVIQQPSINENYYYDPSTNAESYTFSLFPRPKGTIVTIYGEEEELTFITPLKLVKKLLDRVWVTKNEDDKIAGLSFLTIDFEPVEVPARLRKEPSGLSLRLRKELSLQVSYKIKDIAQRINDNLGEISLDETSYGAFGVTQNGSSRILIIPVPINHKPYTEEEEVVSLRRYMAGAVNMAREKIQITTPVLNNSLTVDQIIFSVDDVLGFFDNQISSDLGFHDQGLYNKAYYTAMKDPLEDIRARLMWVDTLENYPVDLPDNSITLEEVFNDEADFCAIYWPENSDGRWKKIQAMLVTVGLSKLFKETASTLILNGWRMSFGNKYYNGYTHEIEYIQPDKTHDDEDALRVRFLLSMSNTDKGIAIAAGRLYDETLLKDVIFNVQGKNDVEKVIRDISRLKPRKKKPF